MGMYKESKTSVKLEGEKSEWFNVKYQSQTTREFLAFPN